MAIITAIADAERTKQYAITSEEQGKANVMMAKYEKEVVKDQAVEAGSLRRNDREELKITKYHVHIC